MWLNGNNLNTLSAQLFINIQPNGSLTLALSDTTRDDGQSWRCDDHVPWKCDTLCWLKVKEQERHITWKITEYTFDISGTHTEYYTVHKPTCEGVWHAINWDTLNTTDPMQCGQKGKLLFTFEVRQIIIDTKPEKKL